MDFYDKNIEFTLNRLNSSKDFGLSSLTLEENFNKYGKNRLTDKKKTSLFKKILTCLKEPMILILIFGLVIAFGAKLGSFLKTGEGDFSECIGILFAIVLSASITIIMEGSSEKAFFLLNKIYDNLTVKVIRDGEIVVVNQQFITVGDVVLLENGDKIIADGRLIETKEFSVDESSLTGESKPVKKDADVIKSSSTPIAERNNFVYSGTFVVSGNGKMVVTEIGDRTEIGKIASELKEEKSDSPLQNKLLKLGKTISVIGIVSALIVFVLSLIRLITEGALNFDGVQELFISCIILIVAAVPEGLPTIVAVSLALNMIKLAKENALIKKMVATETMGAVSVICSDKTGTLTENKMTVESFCGNGYCLMANKIDKEWVLQNFVCNSTADMVKEKGKMKYVGSATECSLLESAFNKVGDINEYRKGYTVIDREPFSSDKKYMITKISTAVGIRYLLKGAPERVLERCDLTQSQKSEILKEIFKHQENSERILCFAHKDFEEAGYLYDGFAVISDPVRKEVFDSVSACKSAGIKIKMLTGDNLETAFAIAKKLDIARDKTSIVNGSYLEGLSDEELKKVIPKITVVARSTPIIKLRIVKALKSLGEVVAVTGDGVNDAPAVKHADIGIAMGKSGSEITKEAADAILLDDSFETIVKAVAFGRNVYRNLQRFIVFQLSVNLSALLIITLSAIFGFASPFNTFQLLWINVIMDGPPALTLGLEKSDSDIMKCKPIDRKCSIVTFKMLLRILVSGIFMGVVVLMQYVFNFLGAKERELPSAVFTLFVLFQLFNAFNARKLGAESIFNGIGKNKVMGVTFFAVFLIHIVIVQIFSPMNIVLWIKCISVAFSIIIFSEGYKLIYRIIRQRKKSESDINKKVVWSID